MNVSSLREFIVFVPTCDETASLADIWQQFQQTGAEQVVILADRRRPMGLVRLNRFVAAFGNLTGASAGQLTGHSVVVPLAQSSVMDYPAFVESLSTLVAETSWEQLQLDLATLVQRPIALVDGSGQYVGLLDWMQVLHHLATQTIDLQSQTVSSSASSPAHAALDTGSAAGITAPTERAFLDPLIDLLERLPLPLMLQTSAGRVITQNLAWRQRVGAIQHLPQIRRAAARILEADLACQTDSDRRSDVSVSFDARRGDPEATHPSSERKGLFSVPIPEADSAHQVGTCQLASEPNACVCVCSMKNGPDRVWQFIKVPMGVSRLHEHADEPAVAIWDMAQVAAPSFEATSFEATSFEATSFEPAAYPTANPESGKPPQTFETPPFKLASLKFNPDPNWRLLIQTETLWLVLAQDMTEEQQVAKELTAKNADLIQLNRLKDEFLACISHELKTPLTAVLGMSSLLKDQLLGDLNERQSHYAQLIYRSGRHLVAIINSILDLTRIETGQLELLLEQIHLPTLCQHAYKQAQKQHLETNAEATAGSLDLRFQLEMQPKLEFMVADELRLRQMLTHLLSNAIKFTEPGGAIGLRVETWEGWIAFTVWDTGIGIPAEKQHLIFQKFQQLEQPLTRQFHGTGLGLVLTQRLARLHGGDISFTSAPGQGSQFTLLLPPVPPQASETDFDLPTARRHPKAVDRNRLVLIVESDARLLEKRVEQLTELGYRAVIARSGTEAIEKARRLQPAAILLNPLLPLLSGWDVLTLLKTDETTHDIPVVITAVRVEREQAYQTGADAFLRLPIELSTLQNCLSGLIQPLAPEPPPLISDLTVLHLHEGCPSFTLVSPQLNAASSSQSLLQSHCRILEVDDLDQADLLARVWKPDVVLIDRVQTNPQLFMQQLSRATALADLPLITLTAELTHAANQIPGLAVFPYLATIAEVKAGGKAPPLPLPNLAELMQVMQLAAKVSWIPHILLVDCAAIVPPAASIHPSVQALTQYLQTAGFRSTASKDWHKVAHQLQHQGVDLLLLCVSLTESPALVSQIVQTLEQLPEMPILVWNYQPREAVDPETLDAAIQEWYEITPHIQPNSLSILELLAQIHQVLAERRSQTEINPE
jgi:signal transduction histidine kinase/DNA-binding response OmpR family regulator